MSKLTFVVLLSAMPCVFAQSLKTEDLNVFITNSSWFYASEITDLSRLDFANLRAINVEGGEWQELKRGCGKSKPNRGERITEVTLRWRHLLDPEHWVVNYDWFEAAGSSNSFEIVQVFELRDGKVYTRSRF